MTFYKEEKGMTGNLSPVRVMDFRGTYKGGGGPDKTILNSAAQHNQKKVSVLVTYIRQPDDHEFQITRAAKELGIHYVELVDRRMLDWSCISQVRRLLLKERIALLHSHDDKTLLYSVILKYLVPGLRIMHTCHSHSEYAKDSFARPIDYRKFQLRKKIQLWLMQQHLPPVITISDNTRQRLVRGGLKKENVAVLYNGIDVGQWSRQKGNPVLRKEFNLRDDDILVGTVARITYDKDLPTFYKVAEQVRKQTARAKFVIVGDGYGNELERAKNDVVSLGLENTVIFTGHRTDLKDVYSSFDLFLMTSRTEGLPNTVLEAMAMEVPVISTSVGGVPELIRDGKEGYLCSVGDTSSLATAVCTLMNQPQLRRRMQKKSRRRVEEKFSFTKRVRMLEDIYLYFSGKGDLPI